MRNILFICTGNSARSIMAEAYLNHVAAGRWRAFSAGSSPTGAPNPFAISTLAGRRIDPGAPASKSWDRFAEPNAPPMDVIVTVCDNAAGEVCPIWPQRAGRSPTILHWPFPDPAAAAGEDAAKQAAFDSVFIQIKSRIDAFLKDDA